MSEIHINTEDGIVVIDGDPQEIAFTGDPTIDFIHWDTVLGEGEIEYKSTRASGVTNRKENEVITNFAPYQHFIADHGDAKSAKAQQVLDDLAQIDIDRDAANVAALAALAPAERASSNYPGAETQLYALHKARQGDNTLLDAVDAEIIAQDAAEGL